MARYCRRGRTCALIVFVFVLAACGSAADDLATDQAAIISTTPSFYFLPPITPKQTYPGVFDPTLSPVVEIDRVDPVSHAVIEHIVTFTRTKIRGSERVRVSRKHQAYVLKWRTARYALRSDHTYRISVVLDGQIRGVADLDVVDKKKDLKHVDESKFVGVVNGDNLKIRFRIEGGIAPPPGEDADGDGVADASDNCPSVANHDQRDTDDNGIGDACECLDVVCGAIDPCHQDGVCDPTSGDCVDVPKPDGAACDDGDACPGVDTCQSGTCVAGDPQVCIAADPESVATAVDPRVAPPLADQMAFLYSGPDPIQVGVAPGAIAPSRIAVLRGRVITPGGAPLGGVTVGLHDDPRVGRTLTRMDGTFDLAINGGGPVRVELQRPGYLPAQRLIDTTIQDYQHIDDVALVPLDPAVTVVALEGNDVKVARASVASDADGPRRATLMFAPDTTATMTLPDGSRVPLETLHVRATEYTVGPHGKAAMPGELPTATAYTYAVELSVDEAIAARATDVTFSQPVAFYLENFIGFPVGGAVPAGYYDRAKGVWITGDNGRVVRVTAISGGAAELDIDGDGAADSATALAALGITLGERQRLAGLYGAGASLWRVPIPHFTPWDMNWPYGPPDDAKSPDAPPPDEDEPEEEKPCESGGSILDCHNRGLGESLAVPGAPFALRYNSRRMPGRLTALSIPITGESLPASLRGAELEISVAGKQIKQSFGSAPGQSFRFEWGGKDAYGRAVHGKVPVQIRVGYRYGAVYYPVTNNFERAFDNVRGRGGNISTDFVTGRTDTQEIIFWRSYTRSLERPAMRSTGGWNVDVHHTYDARGQVLHLGNGEKRSASSIGTILDTGAGTGTLGHTGDGGPARLARLANPAGIDVGADGSVYFAERDQHVVRKIAPDGTISTIAGTVGQLGFAGDGGPATAARFNTPTGITVGPDGSIFVVDTNNLRVRKIDRDGIITTVAGTGVRRTAHGDGDGGLATSAPLTFHDVGATIGVGADGSLYIPEIDGIYANATECVVRRVAPDGRISTFAGLGPCLLDPTTPRGDGTLATTAKLAVSWSAVVGRDGTVYVGGIDGVRKITFDGVIGTRVLRPYKLGGTSEILIGSSMKIGPDDTIYVTTEFNNSASWRHCVEAIDPLGNVTTVAGAGPAGATGDGGPALAGTLQYADGAAIAPDGTIWISDAVNNRIRRTRSVLPGYNNNGVVVPAPGGRELFEFDRLGRHLATRDATTGALRLAFGYDAAGDLASITDSHGDVTTIARGAGGAPTAIHTPGGLSTSFASDGDGRITSVARPGASATTFGYDAGGLLRQMSDDRGTYQFGYDGRGRLQTDQDPAGGMKTLSRTNLATGYRVDTATANGPSTSHQVEFLAGGAKRLTTTGADGRSTQATIQPNGITTATMRDGTQVTITKRGDSRFSMQAPVLASVVQTRPSGITTTTTVSESTVLSDPTNPLSLSSTTRTYRLNGATYTQTYNAATRTQTTTSPTGRQTRVVLDAQGRQIERQVGTFAAVRTEYDATGRASRMLRGSGTDQRSVDYGYVSGRIASADSGGGGMQIERDASGRIAALLAGGQRVDYGYDAHGNRTSTKLSGRPASTTTYDALNQETSRTVAGLTSSFTYNSDRQLTGIARAEGAVTFAYDAAKRLHQTSVPGGAYQFNYDATGEHLASLTAPSGVTLSYTYDGPLLLRTAWAGSITGGVSRIYNANHEVTSSQVDGTPAVAFTYDLDGVMTNAGGMSITSNVLGRPTATALGTVSESLTYNAFGELATRTAIANGTPLLSEQYTRDRNGRITMRVETIDGTTSVLTYTYDARGRLVAVTKDGAALASYGYDANGNRVTWSRAGETRTASYDDGDRLLALGDATFTYTQNGERLSSSDATYAFDALGNLAQVTRSDGTAIAYVLDGHDRRIGKRIGSTLVQGFLYDDLLRPIAELSGSGAVVSRFVYANGLVPTSMIRGGATYRILSDERGSPRLVVAAATGAIVQRMDYDELGNVLADTNPGFQPFGFAGGLYDRDTRLTHFGAREYDAATGTWLSADPLGFASGDTNMYAYCGADPINHIDPTGLAEEHYNIPTGETRGPYFHILDPENTEGEYVTAAVRRHEVQHFFQNALMVFLTPLFVPPWILDRGAFRKEAQFIQYLLDHACEYGLDKPERARERAALEKMLEEARAASTEEGAKKYLSDNSIDPNIGLVQAWNKFTAWLNE